MSSFIHHKQLSTSAKLWRTWYRKWLLIFIVLKQIINISFSYSIMGLVSSCGDGLCEVAFISRWMACVCLLDVLPSSALWSTSDQSLPHLSGNARNITPSCTGLLFLWSRRTKTAITHMYVGRDSIVLLTLRVSAHEVWRLAGWIQEHQQCSEEWLYSVIE